MILYVALAVLSASVEVQPLSTGATFRACEHMTPIHGPFSPQTKGLVYSVEVSATSYFPNDTIRVALKAQCGEPFVGFLLQARRAHTDGNLSSLTGFFNTPPGSQAVHDCGAFRQAVTQDSTDQMFEIEFEWTAPWIPQGDVVMTASFVRNFSTFWTWVYSDLITDRNGTELVNVGNNTYPSPWLCPRNPSVIRPEDQCVSDENCHKRCSRDFCDFVVSWRRDPAVQEIRFHLTAAVGVGENKWMALGFSDDKLMGNDSVFECVSYGGEISMYLSFNEASTKQNHRLDTNLIDSVTSNLSASLRDGVFACSFTRRMTVNDIKVFDLKQPWYLLFAWGNTESNSDAKQLHEGEAVVVERKTIFSGDDTLTTAMPNGAPATKGLPPLTWWTWIYFSLILLSTWQRTRGCSVLPV